MNFAVGSCVHLCQINSFCPPFEWLHNNLIQFPNRFSYLISGRKFSMSIQIEQWFPGKICFGSFAPLMKFICVTSINKIIWLIELKNKMNGRAYKIVACFCWQKSWKLEEKNNLIGSLSQTTNYISESYLVTFVHTHREIFSDISFLCVEQICLDFVWYAVYYTHPHIHPSPHAMNRRKAEIQRKTQNQQNDILFSQQN